MADDLVMTMLKQDEGLRLSVYEDTTGNLTVGYGHLLSDDELISYESHEKYQKNKLGYGDTITEEQANQFLVNDIKIASDGIAKELPWTEKLDISRHSVIVCMAFNLGISGLLAFRNTLHAICLKNWEEAADAMLKSKWATQVGDRAKRYADIILTGDASAYLPKKETA